MKRFILLAFLLILTACHMEGTYYQISQEEAMEMMANEEDYIILDVREPDEFRSGHIKDAICIPVGNINHSITSQLPDKDQLILVYCRSGNRSVQASIALADFGYTRVYEFGGIITWQGEIIYE